MALLTLMAIVCIFLLKPIPQDFSYHRFADHRALWGIPNFANVISNLPFLPIGVAGLLLLRKSAAGKGLLSIYAVLLSGILLTGLGSAYYHTRPDNYALIYDRLPMTLVFMALLSATISEQIDLRAGTRLLIPLLAAGIGSVAWWYYTETKGAGNLRLYILIQYYTIVCIPLIIILSPSPSYRRASRLFIQVLGWYALAKLFDYYDPFVYSATGFVSGHSLKHLAAAAATWWLVKLFREKHIYSTYLVD